MRAIARKLQRKLKPADTEERCGIVLVDGTAVQLPNVHQNPERGFMIRVEELIKHGDELAGTWHTHPGGTSVLSQDDYQGFRQWPSLTHYIVGADGVRAYRVDNDAVMEVSLAAD